MRVPTAAAVRAIAVAFSCAALAGACSANGDDDNDSAVDAAARIAAVCDGVERLAAHAAPVQQADVGDPEQFLATLDAAVDGYLADLRALREVVPRELRPAIDEMATKTRGHDFGGATTARAPLDEFTRTDCNVTSTTTTSR